MASARSVIGSHKPKKRAKRMGSTTIPEKNLVAAFVADQPAALTPAQIGGLARTLRRSKEATLALIEEARESFVGAAGKYVDIHLKATQDAAALGTANGLDIAQKGAQWAMENVSAGGARIVDKAVAGPSGTKILVGITVGGIDAPKTVIDIATPLSDPTEPNAG